MKDSVQHEITELLNGAVENPDKRNQLDKLVYSYLKRIAGKQLSNEGSQKTVTVTSLVHEAFFSLERTDQITWESRKHYFGAAAEAMRRILIDRARYHLRNRREGSKNAVSLDESLQITDIKPTELIALNDALIDLRTVDKDLADILELKYFVGLSAEEIAPLYDISPRTAARRLTEGRAWLYSELTDH